MIIYAFKFRVAMSKKLKFESLVPTRNLRSRKVVSRENVTSETSPYFDTEENEPSEKKMIQRKRRAPVKVKYEESTSIHNENLGKTTILNELQEIKTEIKSEKSTSNINLSNISDAKKNTGMKNEKWMPVNWKITLKNIREMRKYQTAPVDDMGCHKCADPLASPKVSRFQSLVALMLSSQTKDQVTHAAMQRLNAHGCTPQNLLDTPNESLGKLIYPVGFWKKKAEYIKKVCQILLDKYDGDIPDNIKSLCELPGVGPKMAHICMQVAWGKISGIGIDTHVHRICNRLEWVKKPTKAPEETRVALEDWLPTELWSEINHLLVGFGQEICLPRFPLCGECLNKNICPYMEKNAKADKK